MTYYLLLGHLEHPAETINAMRAWGSSVKDSKTYQGMANLCHFQALLEVRTKSGKHNSLSLDFTKKSTSGADTVDELAQLKLIILLT